jgi:small subunit ribosomal protein S8
MVADLSEVDFMSMTDPIADMLTRVRNANQALHDKVDVPSSKLKVEIAKVMKEEGLVKNFKLIDDKKQGILRIYMKYGAGNHRVLSRLERVSHPGLRVYVKKTELARTKRGLGVSVVSTSRGVMSDKKAQEMGLGGELICYLE